MTLNLILKTKSLLFKSVDYFFRQTATLYVTSLTQLCVTQAKSYAALFQHRRTHHLDITPGEADLSVQGVTVSQLCVCV